MKRFLKYWLPPLIWMTVIFVVSAQPSLPSAPARWDTLLKKAMHALAYGTLAWLYLRALRGSFPETSWLRVASWGLAFVYALSDEYHQTFVPGRNGTLMDVTIDGLGAGGAMLLDWWWRRIRSTPAS
jgi:VanZ family protein